MTESDNPGSSAGWGRLELDRRGLVRASGYAALALGAGALGACGAAATEVFNPAVDAWLANLASSVAATEVTKALDGGLQGIWAAWSDNVLKSVNQAMGSDNYWYWNSWVHTVPPVVLVPTSKQEQSNPMTDQLIACVNTGSDAVLFEAWAWQALSMFVHDLTSNKSGDDLAGFRALCVLSLIPSATANSGASPKGSVGWMTYQTHNGVVEIAEFQQADGSTKANVTAYGIPDGNGNPMKKTYTLPTKAG